MMFGAAQIHEAAWAFNQRRQYVGGKGIHCEDPGMTLRRRPTAWLPVNARVMNHRIHKAERVDLFRDAPSFGTASEIADHDPSSAWSELGQRRRALR